jgi:hypothetical protein
VRVAVAAFVAAAIFLAGVMVGLGSGDARDREVPVAITLVDEGTTATPNATPQESNVKEVQHPARKGEVDDNSGPSGDKAEYWEEESDDNSGPGGGDDSESDSSGPGSGDDSSGSGSGDDSSGSGSGDDNSGSGSGSEGSGDSSGPG